MSETPRPLWELVERWAVFAEKSGNADWSDGIDRCKQELAAALRAWDEQLKDISYVGEEFDIPVEGNWVRQQLLGVPPKEPAQKASDD
jgi:hypothetical protein